VTRIVGLVLAAGAGSRFGGDKLAATLGGRALLDHVLDALAAVPLNIIVAVVRPGQGAARTWPPAVLAVENPAPERGLASSLRIGRDAIEGLAGGPPDGFLVALGDQPLLDPALVRRMLAAAQGADRPVVVPTYEADTSRNPVLVMRAAFGLVDQAVGDRGLGPVLDANADLVLTVTGGRANPDVDTPADLAALERRP
jgi:molybdenum cofactor cytidylyltransferase